MEQEERLATPPLSLGLLPGVQREQMLADGKAVERELRVSDLENGFLLGNAVRRLMHAELMT